jgi:hypothetical protein
MPNMHALPLAFWIAFMAPAVAFAHIDKLTGQDYNGFERNDGKGSCCDWHDCRPALMPFMEKDGEKITDLAGNKYLLDKGKIVHRPSDDGNWHVCGDAHRLNCIIAPQEAKRGPTPLDRLLGKTSVASSTKDTAPLDDSEIARQLAAAPICRAGVP